MKLDARFVARVRGAFGEAGDKWLDQLPEILKIAAERWSLTLSSPFEPLSYNYVAPAIGPHGDQFILKAGVPCRELRTEVATLGYWHGEGAVRLLESDSGAGLLLLERAVPGVPLAELPDDDLATRHFAAVVRELHKPPPQEHDFPSIADWAQGFARVRKSGSDFPREHLDRAERLTDELIDSMSEVVLLHGDLHHWNILSAKRRPWLAIDPKGVIGEPEYEVGAWLRNPYPEIFKAPDLEGILSRRIDILADELGFSKQRLVTWGYSQAVLSAVWSYEEDLVEWREGLEFATRLLHLLV